MLTVLYEQNYNLKKSIKTYKEYISQLNFENYQLPKYQSS